MKIMLGQKVQIVCGPDVRCHDKYNGLVGEVVNIHPQGHDWNGIPCAALRLEPNDVVPEEQADAVFMVALEALQPAPQNQTVESTLPEKQQQGRHTLVEASDRDLAINAAILAILQARYPRVQIGELVKICDTVVPKESNEEGAAYCRIGGFAFAKVIFHDPFSFTIAINPDDGIQPKIQGE